MEERTTEGSEKPERTDKADRIRLIIDTTDIVRRAVQLRSLKMGVREQRVVTHSEVVNSILLQVLAEEIGEIRNFPGAGATDPPSAKPKPKRKRGTDQAGN